MTIGRFYLRQGEYLAAINRFRTVIDKYQTTSHAPEALERLTEAYLALGVVKEAQTSAAVLGYNYPGTDWYMDAYNLLTESESGAVGRQGILDQQSLSRGILAALLAIRERKAGEPMLASLTVRDIVLIERAELRSRPA